MRQPQNLNNLANRWHFFAVSLAVIGVAVAVFLTNHTTHAEDEVLDPITGLKTRDSFKDLLQKHYPDYIKKDSSSTLYTCKTCHIADIPSPLGEFNSFGVVVNQQYDIENARPGVSETIALTTALNTLVKETYSVSLDGDEDPDGDSFTNFEEILAQTFPGDATSKPSAGFTLNLAASTQATVEGEQVTLTFTINNTGTVRLTNLAVNVLNLCSTTLAELGVGGSQSTTCTFTAQDNLTNVTATAQADAAKLKNIASQPSNAFSLTVEPTKPEVEIAVVPDRVQVTAGQNVNFSIAVSNTGNVLLNNVRVSTPRTPACNRTFAMIPAKQALAPYSCVVTIVDDLIEARNGEYLIFNRFVVTGTDSVHLAVAVIATSTVRLDATNRVMLPLIVASNTSTALDVDLIVKSVTVNNQGVKVVVKNRGTAELSGIGYWVDLYINPTVVPTRPNQLSEDWGDYGLVWGVLSSAQALGAEGELTLSVANNDGYFSASHSNYPAQIAEGGTIYVQVDSTNKQTNYGAVLETHERLGDDYNNVYKIILKEKVSTANWRSADSRTTVAPSPLEEQVPR